MAQTTPNQKYSEDLFLFYPFVSNFGGIERLILDLSQWLETNNLRLNWIGFQNKITFQDFGATNITPIRLQAFRNLESETRALRSWYQSTKIRPSSILVLEMQGAKYASNALPPGYNIHICDPPRLLSHDVTKSSFSLRKRYDNPKSILSFLTAIRSELVYRTIRTGIQKASAAITMTRRNADELEWAFGRPFSIIPPGARPPGKPIKQEINPIPRFLSVCRLEKSKRIETILEAFVKLQHPNAKLTIVGEGSQRDTLESLSQRLGLENRATFTGEVSESELERIYSEHNIFLMPAVQGYGLPALEALSRGLSLVVHKDSGVSEYLNNIPQVQIIDDINVSLLTAMQSLAMNMRPLPIPKTPTANEWSESLARQCGWYHCPISFP